MKVPSIKDLRKKTGCKRRGILYKLHDYLAYFPAKLLLYTPLTANQITMLWIFIQFISALFLLTGKYMPMLIGLVVFQSMFILDCADGIVARYKKQFSLNGIYLDYLGHYINNPTLLICLSIGLSRMYDTVLFILIGLVVFT